MALKEHPRYASMDFPDYEYQEFPRMIYPGAADQKKPYGKDGKPLKGIIVHNEDEERIALGLPTEPDPEEAPRARPVLVETGSPGISRLETPEDQKAALLQEADVLGLTVDKRWSIARLQDAIDTHKQAAVI